MFDLSEVEIRKKPQGQFIILPTDRRGISVFPEAGETRRRSRSASDTFYIYIFFFRRFLQYFITDIRSENGFKPFHSHRLYRYTAATFIVPGNQIALFLFCAPMIYSRKINVRANFLAETHKILQRLFFFVFIDFVRTVPLCNQARTISHTYKANPIALRFARERQRRGG